MARATATFTLINYQTEKTTGQYRGLNGLSSSIFITRNQDLRFRGQPGIHVLTVVNRTNGSSYPLSLPGVYRVSVNPGGSMALAFVQNSNYVYYPRQADICADDRVFRRAQHLAQGRGGLRAAERAGLVPVPGAEPGPRGRERATSMGLRWRSTGRSRRCSPPTAERPTC